jgi:hypothetical protein
LGKEIRVRHNILCKILGVCVYTRSSYAYVSSTVDHKEDIMKKAFEKALLFLVTVASAFGAYILVRLVVH